MKHRTGTFTAIAATVICAIIIAYFCLPYYARQALIHLYPKIDDCELFFRDTVSAPETPYLWAKSHDYNRIGFTAEETAYLDSMETVSFLIVRKDSILVEDYRNGWSDSMTSNIYSCTKSIVSLLAGAAYDEGCIASLDDPVSEYIPSYTKGLQAEVTVKDLLTMSGGMAWDEAYSSLFSLTTHGYYGNDLFDLVTKLEVSEKPGLQYDYRSGETQLLAFVVEAATGTTLSAYAEEKLWKPLGAEHDAYWLLDKENGDEKAFCCFHTTARDAARFGALMLDYGKWEGQQIISRDYMQQALSPAVHLKNEWGEDSLDYYGYQFWIQKYKGREYRLMRGMLGQYIVAIPEYDAVMVRLGKKRSDEYVRESTVDLFEYMDMALRILEEDARN
ncbi:MAG: serine hydrolase [Bacteroidetes bacterium]|uniref:Serine hydrolase n=1 Tax=Candidatus Merdivivens pullicola TaxID=2840872 RepID=A0A9D9IGA8_9BACT|nr:serine hydrolase [Candidatus Merdivivens pullicola]